MEYSSEQIWSLPTKEFESMKGKLVEVTLKDKPKNESKHQGTIENLIECSLSRPSSLIGAIIIDGTKIEISQIDNLKLIT